MNHSIDGTRAVYASGSTCELRYIKKSVNHYSDGPGAIHASVLI